VVFLQILTVSVREALNSCLKGLEAGQITTGIDQGVDGGMAFDGENVVDST